MGIWDKIALFTRIIFIVIAAILLLGNFLGDSTFPLFLGLPGIFALSVSLKGKK